MAVPPTLIALAAEIDEYNKSDAAKPSPYMSESFGGYTYQKFSSGVGGDASAWQRVFASKLNPWRKLV
jgi:hypothetical protein